MFYWFLLDDNVNQSSVTLIASLLGVPGGSVVENLPASAGDVGLTPGQEGLLEKGVETHFSSVAWGIPWTGEPGGPQSMGPQSVTADQLNSNNISLFILPPFPPSHHSLCSLLSHFLFFFNFYFYFILLHNTILVLPYIDMNQPQMYMSSPS